MLEEFFLVLKYFVLFVFLEEKENLLSFVLVVFFFLVGNIIYYNIFYGMGIC